MTNKNTQILVKVGIKSSLKFSHSKVFRAITSNDLVSISKKYEDCHIVVIENINEDEQEDVKKFVIDFKTKNEKNNVYFFIPDSNDNITSGIADELAYDICLTVKELYDFIYRDYNINVSTLLEDKKRLNSANLIDSMPDGVTDIFGEIVDDTKSTLEGTINEAISNISDMPSLEEIEEPVEIIESTNEKEVKTVETVEIAETTKEKETTPVELIESTKEEEVEPVKETKKSKEKSVDKEEINKLNSELDKWKNDYNTILKDMKQANSRINSLEDIVRAVEDEKAEMLNRYNELVDSSDIFEDPISLSEYEKLNETIEKLNKNIKDLELSVESHKKTIKSKEDTITENVETIDTLNSTIDTLKSEIASLNSKLESEEIHQEVINEYSNKIERIEIERDNAKSKLDEALLSINNLTEEKVKLGNEINTLKNSLADTETKIKELEASLKNTTSQATKQDSKIKIVEKEKELLNTQVKELEDRLKENSSKVLEQASKIIELEATINSCDTKIALATSELEIEKQTLISKNSELETKLMLVEQQLTQKENQYNQLVSTSGIDANGASVLVQNNKLLENKVKMLNEQLGTLNIKLTKAIKDNGTLNSSLQQHKTENENLKAILKNSDGGKSLLVNAEMLMKPIQYNGKAQIISVLGAGGQGVTTTAMSIAHKIGATDNVLYIDFDMISPDADAWFNIMPICRTLGGEESKKTALEVFFDSGIHYFIHNYGKIVKTNENIGKIHYLSGVYSRLNNDKLISADYTSFFNFLANHYNYIVIDLGKLGKNEINDQLIKNITDISYKTAVVSSTDLFVISRLKNKLLNNKIDLTNVAWLANLATSELDSRAKKLLTNIPYKLMERDNNIYGTRQTFTKDRQNRQRIEIFINSVLFGQNK